MNNVMRWLLHGNLTPAVADALAQRGDTVITLSQAGIDASDPSQILKLASQKQLDVITNDPNLTNAPFEQAINFGRSIVFLQLQGEGIEQDDAVDRLFKRYKRLVPSRLYTVTGTRVKIRQLPGGKP